MKKKQKELPGLKLKDEDWKAVAKEITRVLLQEVFNPVAKALPPSHREVFENSIDDVLSSIRRGDIIFTRGVFTGQINSRVSHYFRTHGGTWDTKLKGWKISKEDLSHEIKEAIEYSEKTMQGVLKKIDDHLSSILPEEVSEKAKLGKILDTSLWREEKSFQRNIKAITVSPDLTPVQAKAFAKQYEENAKPPIIEMVAKQVKNLRRDLRDNAEKGGNYSEMRKIISRYKDSSVEHAQFIAEQETSIMMSKFHQTKMQSAGISKYIWRTTNQSKDRSPNKHTPGNVRYFHAILDGTTQDVNKPPVTDKNGNHHNPGEDFRCRCFMQPIVEF